MELDATFWAMVALILFFAILIFFKVPNLLAGILDKRIAQIEIDIAEAARLRAEAETLLAEYERKRAEAENEAAEIVQAAREEAARMTEDARKSLEDMVARRTRSVEDKIAQAEAQALAEVRARSADLAVEAARLILADRIRDEGDALIDSSIRDVASRLN